MKLLRWSFVLLNEYPGALDEPVQCSLADVFGKQICAVVKCVDLEGSDDVVFDEVLCVEELEVDVFCSFAGALSCSNALALCGVCVIA